jgi:hypothetical protein
MLALAIILVSAPALCHPLHVIRAEAEIEPGRISVAYTFDGEEFRHLTGPGNADSSFERGRLLAFIREYEQTLSKKLIVRNENGARESAVLVSTEIEVRGGLMPMSIDSLEWSGLTIRYRYEYPLARPVSGVTFQQDPSIDADGELPSQIALSTSLFGSADRRTLRLTSRGNSETLYVADALAQSGAAPPAASESRSVVCFPREYVEFERFRAPYLVTHRSGRDCRVDLYVPLPLLETWKSIPRGHLDALTVEEQRSAMRLLNELAAEHMRLQIDNQPIPLPPVRQAVLLPSQVEIGAFEQTGPVGYWSGRAAISYEIKLPHESAKPEIEYRLFNSSITLGRALLVESAGMREVLITQDRPRIAF